MRSYITTYDNIFKKAVLPYYTFTHPICENEKCDVIFNYPNIFDETLDLSTYRKLASCYVCLAIGSGIKGNYDHSTQLIEKSRFISGMLIGDNTYETACVF